MTDDQQNKLVVFLLAVTYADPKLSMERLKDAAKKLLLEIPGAEVAKAAGTKIKF